MEKHLKYIDGTSDKFWQIKTNENNLTVTYGRNGTSGTSQVKTFASNEDCLKAAEKLLAEKIKKGYSETGEVVANGTVKAPRSSKENDLKKILDRFDGIIKTKDKTALPDFLKNELSGNITEFRKHLNKCKRYWMTYTDLSKEPEFAEKNNYHWGTRGDEQQTSIIVVAAIATLDKSSLKTWSSEIFWELERICETRENWKNEIFEHAKPDWLIDFYLDLARQKESWQTPAYHHLVQLEDEGYIQFHPEVYAHSLAKFTNTTHSRHGKKIDCMDFISKLPLSYERDVPELFNYETDIANSRNWGGPDDGLRLWHSYFVDLIAAGKLDRAFVLQKSFEIQTKEWNNGIKTFFRTLIDQLKPTAAELLNNQQTIFPALQSSLNAVVNFGIENCKKISEEPGFDFEAFAQWVAPALFRTDIKAGIKNLLQIFEKRAKQNVALHAALSILVADIMNVPVLELQERAAKFISQYRNAEDPELQEKLIQYQPLMLGKVAETLKHFIPQIDDTLAGFIDAQVAYQYIPQIAEKLNQPIQIPETWNDILFQFGKFVSSSEVADTEILWNAYATQRHLFPEDYQKQLQPYLKQITKDHYGNQIYCTCFKCVSEYFFETKFENLQQSFAPKLASHSHNPKAFDVVFNLLRKLDQKIEQQSTLPLLSFPTHFPFWVEPKVLVERMIQYQKSGEAIDSSDLTIAITRMPRENVAAAIPLLEQLTGEYKAIMEFVLGAIPEPVLMKENDAEERTALTSVSAVAARTFYPEKTFEIFETTYLKEVPFVADPFKAEIFFEEKWNEYYVNYQTKEKARTPSWWELHVEFPEYKKVPANLLYSVDMFHRGSSYYDDISTDAQSNCLISLMPQHTDAIALSVIKDSNNTASGKAGIDGLISNIDFIKPSFYNYLVWALGFFNDKKELRAKSSETLYSKLEEQKIDVALLSECIAFLVNGKYGVFSRLTDALLILKDTTPIHNDALYHLLDGLFSRLTLTESPNQFKKMVEMYYDLLLKTKHSPSKEAKAQLSRWENKASLKKLIKEIKNL